MLIFEQVQKKIGANELRIIVFFTQKLPLSYGLGFQKNLSRIQDGKNSDPG